MAHTRKHRRDNAVSADDLRRDFMEEYRTVPDYFKPDPEGESGMTDDYLTQRAEDDATAGQYKEDYLQWASENRDMLSKFMTALGGSKAMSFMTGQNRESKPDGEYFFDRNEEGESGMVDDYHAQRAEDDATAGEYLEKASKFFGGGGQTATPKAPEGRLDFQGTWAVPTKEQVSKSEKKAADRKNYRKQKGNRDSQGSLMTAKQQAEQDRVYNEYAQTMATDTDEAREADRVFNEYGKTMGTDSPDWGIDDWAGWFSNASGGGK